MKRNIGDIKWPASAFDACAQCLRFMIAIVEKMGVDFSPELPNPLDGAREFISQKISEREYRDRQKVWLEEMDRHGGRFRRAYDPESLQRMIAAALLGVSESDQLNEHLSWFMQLVQNYGGDVKDAIKTMESLFSYNE